MEPSAYDAAASVDWKAAFAEQECEDQPTELVNKFALNNRGHLLNVDQAALREVVRAGVEWWVADPLQNADAIAVEGTLTDAIQLMKDFLAPQKKSALDGLVDFSISLMIESGYLDSYSET